MSAPRMPGHTCPLIDKLKKRIENAFDFADKARSNLDKDDLLKLLDDIRHELHSEADEFEKLREANLALRNCAEYWEAKAEGKS